SVHTSVSATGSRDNVAAMSCWRSFSMAARSAARPASLPDDTPRSWPLCSAKTANAARPTTTECSVIGAPITHPFRRPDSPLNTKFRGRAYRFVIDFDTCLRAPLQQLLGVISSDRLFYRRDCFAGSAVRVKASVAQAVPAVEMN